MITKKSLSLLLFSIFYFLFSSASASAHATPITYQPDTSTVLTQTPDRVRIQFSEHIESEASQIIVLGPDGKSANTGNATLDPTDPRSYQIGIRNAGTGTYTVTWQVVSADDGHFTKGAFVFSVGKETAVTADSSSQIQIQHVTTIPQAITMWLELLGQSLILGMLLMLVGIYKPLKKQSTGERHILATGIAGIFLILLGTASLLTIKTFDLQQLRGTDFISTLRVFAGTLDGFYALVRAGLALLVGLILLFRQRQIFASQKISKAELAIIGIMILTILSRARVSHSAASSFHPAFSVIITAIHLFFKEIWVGGALAMMLVFLPTLWRTEKLRERLFSLTAFSKFISVAFGIVGVTGTYIVWLDLKDPAYIFISDWGNRFIILSLLGTILLALRVYHQLWVERLAVDKKSSPLSWLPYTLTLEALTGVALLFATSFIIITTPPFPPERFTFHQQVVSQKALIMFQVAPNEPSNFLVTVQNQSPAISTLKDVEVTLTNDENSIGPIAASLQERYPGAYVFPRKILSLSGVWKIGIVAHRTDAFDATASFILDYPADVASTRIDPEHRSFGWFEIILILIACGIALVSTLLYYFSTWLNEHCEKISNSTDVNGHLYHTVVKVPINTIPSAIKTLSFGLAGLIFISGSIWILNDQVFKTSFQKTCERDGNFWLESVPMRDGTALSSDTQSGCTLNLGLYHFVDPQEYAYFVRPRQSGVDIATTPAKPIAGQPTDLTVKLSTIEKGQKTGPVEDLGIYHDRIMHVIIVGEDLKTFAHIHTEDLGPISPEARKNTTFPVRYTFPQAGKYTIVVNYVVGGKELSQQSFIEVSGAQKMTSNAQAVTQLDQSLQKDFDGYQVSLDIPSHIEVDTPTKLTYAIGKDGQPITDLQPYLAAGMHLAVVRQDLGRVIHTHGQAYLPGSAYLQQLFQNYVRYHSHFVPDRFGPKIQASLTFPDPGSYVVFGEFKHEGKVITTSFVINVE